MAATGSPWRALARLLASERRRYGALAVGLTVAAALPLAGPILVRRVVDRAATGDATTSDIVGPALAYLGLALLAQLAAIGATWFATVLAWNTANRLRLELAEHVLGLDLEYHRTHAPGELIQRVDGDITNVSDFLGKVVAKVGSASMLVTGMFVVLTVIDWRIGLGFAAYVLVAGSISLRTRNAAVGDSVIEMGAYAQLYGGIEERLTASEDLRANRAGPHVMWRFIEDSVAALASTLATEKAFIRFWGRMQLAITVGLAGALVGSALLVDQSIVSIGTTLLLVQYALLLRKPLEEIVDNFNIIQKATGAMVRVDELRSIRPGVVDDGRTSPAPGALSVECRALGFHYGDGEPILSDIDVSIEGGRSVGLVGRSGGGKSTLTRLVLRLVDATEGELLLGGVPIAEIPMAELRHRVAMIPQEVHVLAASVRDNVALFDHSVSDERVRAALANAGLDALAEGDLDAVLGEDDVSLSAGEEQLLSFARIWLRDPDLIVLDEATARVDPATEVRLERAVAQLVEGRTALIVAHRLSTLRAVDEIIVIEGGKVLEHGDRAGLEADPGSVFRHLLDVGLEATP
jgi:ABC-type multidrug transport system fused ATPase/permease subunit